MTFEADIGGSKVTLKPVMRVPTEILIPCEAMIVPLWSYKRMKHEKWLVHLNYLNRVTQRRVGQEEDVENYIVLPPEAFS